MPPRYAYWTILVDNTPTAFRAGSLEDLMPTFNRLKEKQPTAELKWFQGGKLWPSRLDAREAMRERGERGKQGDFRQRSSGAGPPSRGAPGVGNERPEWRPKSSSAGPPFRGTRSEGKERPEWRPKSSGAGPPLRSSRAEGKERPEWKPKGSGGRTQKLDWQPREPRSGGDEPAEKRKWVPKAEYKKSRGVEATRDSKWRPGGDHKDPRQKYKDAKKAKWTRFKQTIRARHDKRTKPEDK